MTAPFPLATAFSLTPPLPSTPTLPLHASKKKTTIEEEQEDENDEVTELTKNAKLTIVAPAPAELAEAQRKWDEDKDHEYDVSEKLTTVESRFQALQSMGVDIQPAAVEHITRLVREAKLAREQAKAKQAVASEKEAKREAERRAALEETQKLEEKTKARRRASDQADKFLRNMMSNKS